MADFDVNISDGISVEVVITPSSEAGAGVADHGALTGLSDDDHAQYHNNARGDARYSQLGHTHLAVAIDDFVSAVASAIPSSVATDAEVAAAISTAINNLIDSAPGTLDTLAEIATALEDDEDAIVALSTAVNARLTQVQADALYSALGHVHAYADITGKPSTFAPSAHATTHTNGTDDIQSATASQKGLATAAQITKLDGIEANATADQSATEILAAIISGDPADGDFFEWDESSGLLVPVEAPSGGTGNISGAYDIESGSYSDAGMSDEFASGTLNAKWTTALSSGTIDFPGQPGSACYDLTTRSGTLLIQSAYSTSSAQITSMRQADALSSGESLVLSCALPSLAKATSTYTYVGLMFNSSTTFASGTYNQFRVIVNFSGANSGTASVEMATNSASQKAVPMHTATSDRVYLRVSRKTINSTDSFVWMYSVDGIVWTLVWQNTATNFTHTWISTETNTQTNPSISPVYAVNWIRHVASTAHDLW